MPLVRSLPLPLFAAALGGALLAGAACPRPAAAAFATPAPPGVVAAPIRTQVAAGAAPVARGAAPVPAGPVPAPAPAPPLAPPLAPRGGPSLAPAAPVPPGFADLVSGLLPTVVNIAAVSIAPRDAAEGLPPALPPGARFDRFFDRFMRRRHPPAPPPARRRESLGSGFIVDPAGLIVTNEHVIDGASRITVTLADHATLPARVVGQDKAGDLALLRVVPPHPLPAVRWGNSDRVRIGDWVLAIGNPFGLGGTVTAGILSARGRNIHEGPYDDFLQTDAAINRGNSGGPLFDARGRVIGVATAIFSPSGGSIGIGFAIPSDIVRRDVAALRAYGRPRRGWLGARVMRVTPGIAASLGLGVAQGAAAQGGASGSARGALVAAVTPGGPAAAARLRPGDVILRFGARRVRATILPRLVAEAEIGAAVPLLVWRDGRTIALTARIAPQPEAEGGPKRQDRAGQDRAGNGRAKE